jgi:hypothetical protein
MAQGGIRNFHTYHRDFNQKSISPDHILLLLQRVPVGRLKQSQNRENRGERGAIPFEFLILNTKPSTTMKAAISITQVPIRVRGIAWSVREKSLAPSAGADCCEYTTPDGDLTPVVQLACFRRQISRSPSTKEDVLVEVL